MASNRFYIFPEIKDLFDKYLKDILPRNITVINREWQEKFVPNGGIFRKLPILL